jgi:hypothetical protein
MEHCEHPARPLRVITTPPIERRSGTQLIGCVGYGEAEPASQMHESFRLIALRRSPRARVRGAMRPKGTLLMRGKMVSGRMPVVVVWSGIHVEDEQTTLKCRSEPLHLPPCKETCRAVRARMTEQLISI